VKGINKIMTCTVTTEPPFVYKETGEIANYEDQNEMTATFNWLESIGLELQKRDGQHFSEVDESIKKYLGINEDKFVGISTKGIAPNDDPNILRGDALPKIEQKEPNIDLFKQDVSPSEEETVIIPN
jgi:hypothetical protein